MSPERRVRLNALGFVWDPLAADWEEGFSYLQRFHQREGHCRVPHRHREEGYRLGQWVGKQRQGNDTMLPERWQRLDALGFVWNPLAADWEEGFSYLQRFHQREGHCRVPQRHREEGYRLGQWVSVQRKSKDTLSPERRQRLDALGFAWDILEAQWEEGFRFLEKFHQREGHCRVSHRHREEGYLLGQWVGTQRQGKDTMLPERRERLDALGFVWKVH